jgi:hypothetical protein
MRVYTICVCLSERQFPRRWRDAADVIPAGRLLKREKLSIVDSHERLRLAGIKRALEYALSAEGS